MTDLYIRQKILREIGEAGQFKLTHATATIPASYAAGPAREYLLRSGIGSVIERGQVVAPDFPHGDHFQFETCRVFAAGAWIATKTLVEVLGL